MGRCRTDRPPRSQGRRAATTVTLAATALEPSGVTEPVSGSASGTNGASGPVPPSGLGADLVSRARVGACSWKGTPPGPNQPVMSTTRSSADRGEQAHAAGAVQRCHHEVGCGRQGAGVEVGRGRSGAAAGPDHHEAPAVRADLGDVEGDRGGVRRRRSEGADVDGDRAPGRDRAPGGGRSRAGVEEPGGRDAVEAAGHGGRCGAASRPDTGRGGSRWCRDPRQETDEEDRHREGGEGPPPHWRPPYCRVTCPPGHRGVAAATG